MTLLERIRLFRRRLVFRVMVRAEGDIPAAAARLGCSRNYLSVFIHRAGLSCKDFKPGPSVQANLWRERTFGVTQRRSP